MLMTTKGLLLVNLGTPDAPTTAAVRRYLREFLTDPRVIDTHPVLRTFVVYCCILPTRPQASAAAYRKIWTPEGAPLLCYSRDLAAAVGQRLGASTHVELAMRYGRPSIRAALQRFATAGIADITVLPLFPQYSTAAWGSAVAQVWQEASRCWNTPALQIVPPFFDQPAYLDAVAHVSRAPLEAAQADHVVMSFHGLPVRHITKSGRGGPQCYERQCHETAHAVARRLGLGRDRYSIAFQSRLGRDPWITPATDLELPRLARQGVRRAAVLTPAFVADCLETLEEIAIRGRDDFLAAGGEALTLIPSLNAAPVWVDAVVTLLTTAEPRIDLVQQSA
jgi:protoporphyrin/coproporphyrin ferrochelatase